MVTIPDDSPAWEGRHARARDRDGRSATQYSCVSSVKTYIFNWLKPAQTENWGCLLAKSRPPRIFITLAGPNLAAIEAQASRTMGAPVGYELRLDHLQDFTQFEVSLHQMLARLHVPQTIATCRREEAGGAFKGSVEQQAAVLAAAVRAGCQWVDIEFESIKQAGSSLLEQFHPARVIASYHNFRQTPSLGESIANSRGCP